jgi:hypothetical protein
MTPDPPSSSDGSALPPRSRPNLGTLAQDDESDLWAFDDLDPVVDKPAGVAPKPAEPEIPVLRDPEKAQPRELPDQPPRKPVGYQESIRVNVSKSRPRVQSGPSTSQSSPGREFDDLDNWDEPEEIRPSPQGAAEIAGSRPFASPPVTPPADLKNDLPPAVPAGSRPRMKLSMVERLSLVVLALLLLGGGIAIYLNTISRLPAGTSRAKAADFPIQGKHLAIVSAESFWRAPKAGDTVRRGTQLVPAVELTSGGGPAAIRVFFRNDDGDLIGDAVTRYLQSGTKVEIAATAGFDDVGMHTAYRSEDDKTWTIEVFEAPTENSPGPDFKKLFEMDVATGSR